MKGILNKKELLILIKSVFTSVIIFTFVAAAFAKDELDIQKNAPSIRILELNISSEK